MNARSCRTALVILLAAGPLSCTWIGRFAQTLPPPKKNVAAEFDRLTDQKILILTWVDPGALLDYPWFWRLVGGRILPRRFWR